MICAKCSKPLGKLAYPIKGKNYCPLCAVKVARGRHRESIALYNTAITPADPAVEPCATCGNHWPRCGSPDCPQPGPPDDAGNGEVQP